MSFKSLLFIMGACFCVEAMAQVMPSDGGGNVKAGYFGVSSVADGRIHSALAPTVVKPVLKPVRTVICKDGIMRAEQTSKTDATPWNASEIRKRIDGENTLRLDSVIGYNADGSKATLQAFTYNSDGLMTYRANSYYNPSTGGWDLAEEYGYEWTDDGLILDEWGKAYGMGTRRTYVYNDRGWGIEQVVYELGADGEWVQSSKGEYEYDDNANIIAERTYVCDGSQWVQTTKAVATYDSKNRQKYVEGYTWDGIQWVGSVKQIFEWCDKPDPMPVDPTKTDRNTLALSYVWENGQWKPLVAYVNEFDTPDGYITMQKICWWNGRNWGGENGSTSVSYWTYDEHNAITSHDGYLCVNDSTAWVKSYETDYSWTYDEDGNRTGAFETYYMDYDNAYNIVGKNLTERYEEAYDPQGQVTWRKIWNVNVMTGELQPMEEIKRRYNDFGDISYEASWTWENGERKPGVEINYTFDEDGNVVDQVSRNGGDSGIPFGAPATRGYEIDAEDLEGWVNSTHFTYAYENGIRYEKLGYSWVNEAWATNLGQTVEYDFDYPMESLITPVGWADPYKIDALHNLTGDGNNGWMDAKMMYYWANHFTSGIADTTVAGVKVSYAGDVITIAAAGDVDVKVYNAGGACVKTTSEKTVYMGGQPSGVYIVKVNGHTTKIVK